ncbi:nucleotidyltransferase domain-containing protein [Gemelliphila palaticanis]|uniref:Nucleotidyltransferase family protein n=1 Tax=Gemelliphila palaticanis TaxID=81950 RepID=A0ABX2T149_9BACL|nr:nucleotidyltransferase family protein [Gemella palaticanis]MBF0716163.1 nucleotidyltransferase family protein [Gemella palaticanis]NYS48093.1 nucleotidyltransferase family protein [Gemella palaticanis]
MENVSYTDFLIFLRSVIRKEPIDKKYFNEASLNYFYVISKFHSIEALTYKGISSYEELKDFEIVKKWKLKTDKIFRRHLVFNAQRLKIEQSMSEKGIWYSRLKGLVIQNYYPENYLRQMTDNDILFDANKISDLKAIMENQGFNLYNRSGYDYVYFKEPFLNFEMHTNLSYARGFESYFENILSRLISSEDRKEKFLSKEDEYIYILSHDIKHIDASGIGIRSLIDMYYYFNKNIDVLDWGYIDSSLKKCGFLDFDLKRRKIISSLFGDSLEEFYKILKDEDLKKYISSGTHGTEENLIENNLSKYKDKNHKFIRYYFNKVIPDSYMLKNHYPTIYKYKILLPPFIVYRAIRGLLKKKQWRELIYVLKNK